jgi:hypothetical protein
VLAISEQIPLIDHSQGPIRVDRMAPEVVRDRGEPGLELEDALSLLVSTATAAKLKSDTNAQQSAQQGRLPASRGVLGWSKRRPSPRS